MNYSEDRDPSLNCQPFASRRYLKFAIISLGLGILILSGFAAFRFKSAADAKFREELRQLAAETIVWSQMCRPPDHLVTYGIYRDMEQFPVKTYSWLRKDRSRSIAQILEAMDKEFEVLRRHSSDSQNVSFDLDDDRIGGYCAFLVDLNAHEALPSLLAYERLLRPKIELSAPEPKRPEYAPVKLLGTTDEYDNFIYAYLISTMLAILHQENFSKETESDFYEAPDHSSARFAPGFHALTTERRDMIVSWTEAFIKTVPLSERRGPEGMMLNNEPH